MAFCAARSSRLRIAGARVFLGMTFLGPENGTKSQERINCAPLQTLSPEPQGIFASVAQWSLQFPFGRPISRSLPYNYNRAKRVRTIRAPVEGKVVNVCGSGTSRDGPRT